MKQVRWEKTKVLLDKVALGVANSSSDASASLFYKDQQTLEVVVPLDEKPAAVRKLAAGQFEGDLHGVAEQVVELLRTKSTNMRL